MTSNLGADLLASLPEGVPSSTVKGDLMEFVRGHLSPEVKIKKKNKADPTNIHQKLNKRN